MNTLAVMLANALLLGAEYVIEVPEGEVVSNSTAIAAATQGDVLVKTGKGTWYNSATLGGKSTTFSKFEIREGMVEQNAGTGLFRIPRIEIKSGATLKQLNAYSYNNYGVTNVVEQGGVFNDQAMAYGQGWMEVEGPGLFINLNTTWKSGMLANFTGNMMVGLLSDSQLKFGDGASADKDPDIAHIGSLEMCKGKAGTGNYPRLTFQNVEPMTVTNRFGGTGQLTINANSAVTFSNLWLNGGSSSQFYIYGALTNVNGQIMLAQFNMNNANNRYVQIGGETGGNSVSAPTKCPYSKIKWPNGANLATSSGSGYGVRILENGAVFRTAYQQPFYTEVNSGARLELCNCNQFQTANAKTTGERMRYVFNGGTLGFNAADYVNLSDSSPIVTKTPELVSFEIGESGMALDAVAQSASATPFNFQTDLEFTDNGSLGPLSFAGNACYYLHQPLAIGGEVTIYDSKISLDGAAAYYATDAKPALGTGGLTMNQGRIASSMPQGYATRLADATGAQLHLTGSSSLYMASNNKGVDWQIGPTTAAACAIVRDKGAALFIENDTKGQIDFFKNGKGTCVIGGGLPMGTNGKLPVIPIFVQDLSSSRSGDSWGGEVEFLTYSEDGLVRFDNYDTQLLQDAKSVVFLDTSVTLTADVAVAALNVGKSKSVQIPTGMKLTVGDGTGTACVLLNGNTGNITGAGKKGTGTLDFGSSEGVVACCRRGGKITANIAGTGGLSVVGGAVSDVNGWGLTLGGNNTYSGGTRISAYRVLAASDTAFGVGDVWALGGQGRGGQIRFNNGSTKVTLANNLHLAGYGLTEGNNVDDHIGAIWAQSDAEISGAVELAGPTRMVVAGEDTELRFSGVISGDSVQFFNRLEAVTNAGTIVYEKANTYTGKTEVIRSTLELKRGATAGTGDITLDGGVLIVNSNKDGVTLPNVIRGVGTVKVAGPNGAVINFKAAPTEDIFLQQEHTLDLNDRSCQVNSLEGFTSITNSSMTAVHLYVTDSTAFTGEVDENVTVHLGAEYPAPGMIMIVK